MADITYIHKKLSPDDVLESAKGELQDALIIGYDLDGYLTIWSSDGVQGQEALWMLESFKTKLLAGDYRGEE